MTSVLHYIQVISAHFNILEMKQLGYGSILYIANNLRGSTHVADVTTGSLLSMSGNYGAIHRQCRVKWTKNERGDEGRVVIAAETKKSFVFVSIKIKRLLKHPPLL